MIRIQEPFIDPIFHDPRQTIVNPLWFVAAAIVMAGSSIARAIRKIDDKDGKESTITKRTLP